MGISNFGPICFHSLLTPKTSFFHPSSQKSLNKKFQQFQNWQKTHSSWSCAKKAIQIIKWIFCLGTLFGPKALSNLTDDQLFVPSHLCCSSKWQLWIFDILSMTVSWQNDKSKIFKSIFALAKIFFNSNFLSISKLETWMQTRFFSGMIVKTCVCLNFSLYQKHSKFAHMFFWFLILYSNWTKIFRKKSFRVGLFLACSHHQTLNGTWNTDSL